MNKGYKKVNKVMKTQYGVVLGILLLSCSSLNSSLRTTYSIVEDTFNETYIINGVERYDRFPDRKSISRDEMRYSLRTDVAEVMDTIVTVYSIEISHLYHYYLTKWDTTSITIDKVELEREDSVLFAYKDAYSVPAPLGECCISWEEIDIILPDGYIEGVDKSKNMLVRLNDTNKRYEYILTITPEMIAMQEEGLRALQKQLGLEKDDGKVNVIRQTQF